VECKLFTPLYFKTHRIVINKRCRGGVEKVSGWSVNGVGVECKRCRGGVKKTKVEWSGIPGTLTPVGHRMLGQIICINCKAFINTEDIGHFIKCKK